MIYYVPQRYNGSFPIQCEHIGGTWYTTYTRVPHYITSYRGSLVLESLEYAEFDMTSDDSVTIRLNSSNMVGRIISGRFNNLRFSSLLLAAYI